MHKMVDEACKGLAGVSASQVEMNLAFSFMMDYYCRDSRDSIKSASDLIDLDHPNYQFVAARLLLFCFA